MVDSQKDIVVVSGSPEETILLGEKIGACLKGGEIIALCGPLGSGKTHLIKGIAAGTGAADCERVNSPTFVIINEYSGGEGGLDVYHIDAYRLESVAEFEMLGFDDLCYPNAVILIEWADKLQTVLKDIECVWIELSHVNETKRKILIKNPTNYIGRALKL